MLWFNNQNNLELDDEDEDEDEDENENEETNEDICDYFNNLNNPTSKNEKTDDIFEMLSENKIQNEPLWSLNSNNATDMNNEENNSENIIKKPDDNRKNPLNM